MLESIRIKQRQSKPIRLGDVVDYQGKSFIIIRILGFEVLEQEGPETFWCYYCLGQLYGSKDLASNYVPTLTEQVFELTQLNEVPEPGEIFFDDVINIWVIVQEIQQICFEDQQIKVTFKFAPVPEWPKEKIAKAMQKHRLSRMKLLPKSSH